MPAAADLHAGAHGNALSPHLPHRGAAARGPRRSPLAARTEDAVKVYGKGDTEVRALDGVTVGLPAGRFTAIMGPSGSGKSTLMHCLAGLDTLTSGQVFLGDIDLGSLSDRELTQRPPRAHRLRVPGLQPAADARRLREHHAADGPRRPPSRTRSGCARSSRPSASADRLKHRPSELSGGQQQRVAVARALASRPAMIFADEPTGNLDSRTGGEILSFMRAAVDDLGQTIVMVTHDAVAASFADTVLFLEDGRIVDSMANPSPDRILDRMKQFGS